MKRYCALALAVAALAMVEPVDAADLYQAAIDGGPMTEIAGQSATVLGDRVVFFLQGQGRAVREGDILVCTQPGQEMSEVARKFGSNIFTRQYAPTMFSLAGRGFNWLDGGCVVAPDVDSAVSLYRKLGGTIASPVTTPGLDGSDPEPGVAAEWSPSVEWMQWIATNPVTNNIEVDDLAPALRLQWERTIAAIGDRAKACTDIQCFNQTVSVATGELEDIQRRAGL